MPATDASLNLGQNLILRNSLTGQNTIWLMNGTALTTEISTKAVPDANWSLVGAGDFNGDGRSDLVWRNGATGENAIWLMNGTSLSTGVFTVPVADLHWQIVGTGDFNSDGHSDLVWRNGATGENAIWLINGTSLATGIFTTPLADLNWQIVGAGDFNRDGNSDLVWRNKATGENAIWLMNGTSLATGVFTAPLADLNWQIVGSGNFSLSTPAAATYYVATNGSNNNVGTFGSPYQTLQRAIDQITDGGGGTIYVRGGTYQPSQSILIADNHDGSASSHLVIRPYQNERVIVDGSQKSSTIDAGITISGSYVDLMGLEIQNFKGGGIGITSASNVQVLNNTVHDTQGGGIALFNSSYESINDRNSNIYIDGNTIYNTNLFKGANINNSSVNWGQGIGVGFSDNVTVTNNRVYDSYGEGIGFYVSTNGLAAHNVVYDNYALGIYLDSSRNIVVDGNLIYSTGNPQYFRDGVPSNGIQMANETYSFMEYDQSPYHLNNNQILNNIVVNVGTGIVYGTYTGFGNGDSINSYGVKNTAIVNNTIYNPTDTFVQIEQDPNTTNVVIANNIFSRISRDGSLANIPDTSNITVEYNLWFGGNQVEGNQKVLNGTNIQANPGLVNPGSFNAVDYQLRSGSAAINAGTPLSNVSTDYFGQARPASGLYDIGADES